MQLLLPGQDQLGCGKGSRHLAALFGQAPSIKRKEGHAGPHRRQHAHLVEKRVVERDARLPRQRQGMEGDEGCRGHGESPESDCVPERQRGRRNRDRCNDEHRERILDAARQIEQRRQLHDVVGEQERGKADREPVARRVADSQIDVDPSRHRDENEAWSDRQLETEHDRNHADGQDLTQHADPAQPHDRLQLEPAVGIGNQPKVVASRPLTRHARSSVGRPAHPGRTVCHNSMACQHAPGDPDTRERSRTFARGARIARRRAAREPKVRDPMQDQAATTPTVSPPVVVRHLRKVYGEIVAVDGISFALEEGAVTALLGGNGAGKTPTISMLMGLVLPTSGEARVFGASMASERHKVLHRMNFESPYADIPMRLTVRQNLEVFGRLYGVAALGSRIGELSQELRLGEFLDRPYGKLSAGQKTRVSLAKALLNGPELLLLDEPTASLDPDTADWVRSRLEAYRRERGATILLASHNMAEVERLSDRVIMLEAGRIVADETPAGLIRRFGRASLEEVFLDIARHKRATKVSGAQDGNAG